MKKISWFIFASLLFTFSINSVSVAHAGMNYKIDLPKCTADDDFIKYLEDNHAGDYYDYLQKYRKEITETIKVSKMSSRVQKSIKDANEDGTLSLNMEMAREYCIIVYGNGNNLKLKTEKDGVQTFRLGDRMFHRMDPKKIDEIQPLFFGVTLDGQNFYPNPRSPEYFAGTNALIDEPWIYKPWNDDSKVANDPRFSAVPPQAPANINNQDYLKSLTKALDKYNPRKEDGTGNFVGLAPNKKPWISAEAQGAGSSYRYTSESVQLSHYASVFLERNDEKWFPGAFTMYFIRDNYKGKAGYATFLMKPNRVFVPPTGSWDHAPDCSYLQVDPANPAIEGNPIKINLKNQIIKKGNPTAADWNVAKTIDPVKTGDWKSWFGNDPSVKGVQNIPAGIPVAFRWEGISDRIETSTWYNTSVIMSNIPGSNGYSISKATKNLLNGSKAQNFQVVYPKPDADGYASLVVNMNYQTSANYYYPQLYGKPGTEEDRTNNVCVFKVKIKEKQDASVTIDGSHDIADPIKAASDTPLNGLTFTIRNNMKKHISIPCTTGVTNSQNCLNTTDKIFKIVITDIVNNKVIPTPEAYVPEPTGKYKPVTLKPNQSINPTLDGIKLPAGKYKIEIFIPRYEGEEDATKSGIKNTNNYDYTYLQTEILMPPNTKCDKYMKLGASMTDTIAKMCYGYYPNHPSNWTEGGIGTFFAIKYYLLPIPLPNYTVTKGGTADQTLKASEPKTAAGSCSVAKPTDCTDLSTFFYFPTIRVCDANTVSKTDCVSSLPSDYNPKGLKGPYSAGPHSFFHYLYRGRMVAESVQFNFVVYDVAGKAIATNDPSKCTAGAPGCDPNAQGTFIYQVPNGISSTAKPNTYVSRDSLPSTAANNPANNLGAALPAGYTYNAAKDCFRSDYIDYTDACRSITFYLPNPVSNMFATPEEKDKIQFLNVGEHSFELSAIENQKYYYQHDDGEEYQGSRTNPSTLPNGWTAPHLTTSIDKTNQKYTSQEGVANHCENLTDGFGVSLPGQPNCFHDSDAEFQYWLYNWSRPYRYDKDFIATWQ